MTPTDRKRLNLGNRAASIDISKIEAKTPEELKMIYGQLFDGAVALQSTDDLGSEAANKSAMDTMDSLVSRMQYVNQKYKRLTGIDVWTGGKTSQ